MEERKSLRAKGLASHPLGKHPQRLFGFQEKENRKEKRKAKRSLYFTKCKIYNSSSPGTSSPESFLSAYKRVYIGR